MKNFGEVSGSQLISVIEKGNARK